MSEETAGSGINDPTFSLSPRDSTTNLNSSRKEKEERSERQKDGNGDGDSDVEPRPARFQSFVVVRNQRH